MLILLQLGYDAEICKDIGAGNFYYYEQKGREFLLPVTLRRLETFETAIGRLAEL